MKNLSELKERNLNKDFLLKHIEFKLEFAKEGARAKFPGSFNNMMKGIFDAVDDYSIDFLRANVDSDFDIDDFISFIAAEIDEVRKIAQPNTWPEQHWPMLSDSIDESLEKLRVAAQAVKLQRLAPQLAHSM